VEEKIIYLIIWWTTCNR